MTVQVSTNSSQHHEKEYLRLTAMQRVIHLLVVISFFTLAFTGIPLKFHQWWWAKIIIQALGGWEVARYLHRAGAIITFIYISLYLVYVAYRFLIKREKGLFYGVNSIIPRPEDVIQVIQHLIWFLVGGKRPKFDRWTYWEKFDFFAEAWGNFVLGLTGLILWFPIFFTRFLPGWTINMATIIHGIEASLAVCFIFSIHFYNAHLRRAKYPMDMVIVTGRLSEKEFMADRPAEYERIKADNALFWYEVPPASPLLAKIGKSLGIILTLVGLILAILVAGSVLQDLATRILS